MRYRASLFFVLASLYACGTANVSPRPEGAGGSSGQAGSAGATPGAGGATPGAGGATPGAGGATPGAGGATPGAGGATPGAGGATPGAGGATPGAGGATPGAGGATPGAGGKAGAGGATPGAGGAAGAAGVIVGAGGAPAACPASDVGNTPTGTDTVVAGTVNSYTYTNVTGPGTYPKVIQDWCTAGTCTIGSYKEEYQATGALAPFNEDQALVISGKTDLYQIGVYYPSAGAWQRVAYWDRCVTQGLAFTGNKSWFKCNGNVQTYIGNWDPSLNGGKGDYPASTTPVQFNGQVVGSELQVFSSNDCGTAITKGTACGLSTGKTNLMGFTGDAAGSKIFAVKFRMPISTLCPSYWILPGQVLRTSQYGCNCRTHGAVGCGSIYKGGCGEIDVIELVGGDPNNLEQSTSIYSFQACYGGVGRWSRPVKETAIFFVIFHAPTKQIAIRRVPANGFDFGGSMTDAQVNALLAMPGGSKAMP
jgi:hypothetical protein